MNDKTKVFISLPMKGLAYDYICSKIELAKSHYLLLTGQKENDVEFITNVNAPDPPWYIEKDNYGVWYLGHALVELAKCDEALFWFGWKEARGCRIEHEVCKEYKIDILEVE